MIASLKSELRKHAMLITLEGLEGSGKSTQQKRILDYLAKQGLAACGFVEPGDTQLGVEIRRILLDPATQLGNLTELFLFAAARYQLLKEKLIPALEAGQIVVLDRYFDSTTAYQQYGRGLDAQLVQAIHERVVGEYRPDLTFIFDLEPEEGLRRSRGLAKQEAAAGQLDRIEASGLEFLRRVREGYLEIARQEPERCVVIPVEGDAERVFARVVEILPFKLHARKIL